MIRLVAGSIALVLGRSRVTSSTLPIVRGLIGFLSCFFSGSDQGIGGNGSIRQTHKRVNLDFSDLPVIVDDIGLDCHHGVNNGGQVSGGATAKPPANPRPKPVLWPCLMIWACRTPKISAAAFRIRFQAGSCSGL